MANDRRIVTVEYLESEGLNHKQDYFADVATDEVSGNRELSLKDANSNVVGQIIAQKEGGVLFKNVATPTEATNGVNKRYADNNFANALKGTASSASVRLDDVSPIEHTLGVKVSSKNLWQNTNTRFPAALSYNSTNQTYTMSTGIVGYSFVAHTLTNPIPVGTTVTISIMFQSGKGRGVAIGGYHSTGGASWQGHINVPSNIDMTGQTLTSTFTTTETVEEFMVFHNTGDNIEEPFIFKVQYELGSTATAYTPYISDLTSIIVTRYGTVETDSPQTYIPAADGTISGVKSLYPTTTLMTDTEEAIISAEYNRDINKAFAELQQAILSMGGNT